MVKPIIRISHAQNVQHTFVYYHHRLLGVTFFPVDVSILYTGLPTPAARTRVESAAVGAIASVGELRQRNDYRPIA